MSDTSNSRKCCMPGCGGPVPAELETDTLCVSHFLSTAENACAAIRREAVPGGPDVPRRVEIENYVAASAIKLARIGTGAARLNDETKKRVLTTFLTLMILRENLDRTASCFQPRRAAAKAETPSELVAA